MLAAASASTVPIHSCAACSVKYASSAPTSIAKLDSRLSANAASLLYPECSRMTKSPISCGISCAMIAADVTMPPQHQLLQNEEPQDTREHRGEQGVKVRGAADRMRQDLEEDGAQQSTDCKAHERRHPARGRGKGEHRSDRDADHATRDSRRGDPRDRRHVLVFLQPDEARHSAGGLVATKGEKALLGRGAKFAPVDLGDSCRGESLPRKVIEIGEVRPVLSRRERLRSGRVPVDEGLAHVLSDFVATRSDARSAVGDDA